MTVAITSGIVTLAFTSNSWLQFQFDTSKIVTPTVNVSVTSTQIRPGITTNS